MSKKSYDNPEKRQHIIKFLTFVRDNHGLNRFSPGVASRLFSMAAGAPVALEACGFLTKTDAGYFCAFSGEIPSSAVDAFITKLREPMKKYHEAVKVTKTAPTFDSDECASLLKLIVEKMDYQNRLLASFITSFGINE